MVTQTAAALLLDALVAHGVEYLFCNLGTDHAPLIEELARARAEGRTVPTVVLCPHENTAVHMAGGYGHINHAMNRYQPGSAVQDTRIGIKPWHGQKTGAKPVVRSTTTA